MRHRCGLRNPALWAIAFVAIACEPSPGEQRLPGHVVPLAEAFSLSGGFLARCVAVEDPALGSSASGVRQVAQRFRVIELVRGSTHGEALVRIDYSCRPGERPIRRDEVVIWFGRIAAREGWSGTKALLDTEDNHYDADRAVDHLLYEHRPSKLTVSVDYPRPAYAQGEPMPIQVRFFRDGRDSIVVWSDLAAGRFEIMAGDGEPVKRTALPGQMPRELVPLVVGPTRRVKVSQDLADWYEWLAGRDMRTFTLVWRGMVRVGDSNAAPVELVSDPVRFVIRDPTRLAWGPPSEGLACGLAAERDSISQGDQLTVHLGLRFDPGSAAASLGMLNDFSREVGFTFTNTSTGESTPRAPTVFVGPLPPMPGREDFVVLRERPVSLRRVSVSLLTLEGEQLREGTYSVVAWYESEGKPETVTEDCWRPTPYVGPWTFWKGKIASAPIRIHVRHADPVEQELRVNSSFVVEKIDGRTCWGLSQENPLRVRIAKRPGFFLGREDDQSIAIGDDDFRRGSQGWGPIWNSNGGYGCSLSPDDEARLAAGERLAIRAEITIFETSNPPGHLWEPERGDYRVLWQGRIEGGMPARARTPAANLHR